MINIPIKQYRLDQYPKVWNVKFPEEISIAIVLCGKKCGNVEFIVEGQNEVCEYCLRKMKQIKVCKYVMKKAKKKLKLQ
jgi:hypothetical protein